MIRSLFAFVACAVLFTAPLHAQEKITIRVDLASTRGDWRPVWSFFGYDEPNYTYMKYVRKLLAELSALSPVPVYIRTHNLLTSGDGTPALKNVFRMFALMVGDRLKVESDGAVGLDTILQQGVRGRPDINALATRRERQASILVWNYHDDDTASPDNAVTLVLQGIPTSAQRVEMRHYRIDQNHSNAFIVWKGMGSPQSPSATQYAQLESTGRLELFASPQWLWSESGQVRVDFALPRQGVSLLQFTW